MPRSILSLQSQVACGHVGNSAAVFALQRLGRDVLALPTVLLSNHPGHGRFRGAPLEPALIGACVEGLDDIGALADCDGLLTGYLGAPAMAGVVREAWRRLKQRNAKALWCCDPVIGDGGRVYVAEGIVDFLREEALPAADIVTPNLFELSLLAGHPVATLADLREAAAALHARGPRVVAVTSAILADTPHDALDAFVSAPNGLARLRLPRLAGAYSGAGDLFAALFFARLLDTGSPRAALASAGSATFGVLAQTPPGGDLALVAGQAELVAPSRAFAVEALSL